MKRFCSLLLAALLLCCLWLPAMADEDDPFDRSYTRFNDFAGAVTEAGRSYSPALIANYVYDLAKEYNQFYHDYSILREDDTARRVFRLRLSGTVATIIGQAMALLGIEMPQRM